MGQLKIHLVYLLVGEFIQDHSIVVASFFSIFLYQQVALYAKITEVVNTVGFSMDREWHN